MQQLARLVGIARLAAEGSVLAEKRRVEYRSLPTRKWLNRCQSKRVPFDWTINPYRGCEYGCRYCYARFTHEFLEIPDLTAFETEIYAKDWCPDSFRRELRSVRPGQVIGLGTATDPYQPAERKFLRTRELLETLVGVRDIRLFVTTKSDLAARDAELFQELAQTNQVRITFSVITLNSDLTRVAEPFAPRPDLRIEAAAKLAAAGIKVGVISSPVLPLITDSAENLEAVAQAAKSAGADQFGANVLFLQPSAQKVFFPFLAERFPEHLARYQREYASGAFVRSPYIEKIRQRVQDIREKLGMLKRDLEYAPTAVRQDAQLLLF